MYIGASIRVLVHYSAECYSIDSVKNCISSMDDVFIHPKIKWGMLKTLCTQCLQFCLCSGRDAEAG